MPLASRQEDLLKMIIETYIETTEPIGSRFLVEREDMAVSGATVRNGMRDLENAGYLTHPHTSAGRVPTEAGWRYYVEHMMKPAEPKKREAAALQEIVKTDDEKNNLKTVARYVSDATGAAVIIAFERNSAYYTGISNLFAEPEFRDYRQTVSISAMFDQCEERLGDIYDAVEGRNIRVMLGRENPLGNVCGLVAAVVAHRQLFALLSPLRTNYARNMGMVQCVRGLYE